MPMAIMLRTNDLPSCGEGTTLTAPPLPWPPPAALPPHHMPVLGLQVAVQCCRYLQLWPAAQDRSHSACFAKPSGSSHSNEVASQH